MVNKKVKRKYRINLVIMYCNQISVNCFQPTLHELISFYAWIYKLDYAISSEHQFASDNDYTAQSPGTMKADLVYFRSTQETKIELKDFRKIINGTFDKYLSWICDGIELFFQPLSVIAQYPFPDEFRRPLRYPYVEAHRDGESKVCIPRSFVEGLLEDDDLDQSLEVVLN